MLRIRTAILLILSLLVGYVFLFSRSTVKDKARLKDTMAAALQPLRFLTVAPRAKHTATVIFIHVRYSLIFFVLRAGMRHIH